MEIEAKFTIPDPITAKRLKKIDALDSFTLDAPQTLKMRDTFFDTTAQALHAVKSVLRVRRRNDGKSFVTLKTAPQKRGAVHRRPEFEAEANSAGTPKTLSRENLPPRIYKQIASLVDNASMQPLFSITQTRHIRALKKGRRVVGEWSVDRVEFRAGARRQIFYELEIELKKSGTEQELAEILAALRKQVKLQPQLRGKFERAYEFMQTK